MRNPRRRQLLPTHLKTRYASPHARQHTITLREVCSRFCLEPPDPSTVQDVSGVQVIPCSPLKPGSAAATASATRTSRAHASQKSVAASLGAAANRHRVPAPSPGTQAVLGSSGDAAAFSFGGAAKPKASRLSALKKQDQEKESLEHLSGLYLNRRVVSQADVKRSMRGRVFHPLKAMAESGKPPSGVRSRGCATFRLYVDLVWVVMVIPLLPSRLGVVVWCWACGGARMSGSPSQCL